MIIKKIQEISSQVVSDVLNPVIFRFTVYRNFMLIGNVVPIALVFLSAAKVMRIKGAGAGLFMACMMYLYNLASIHKGIVMDTDNLTENNLGYWTLHGDVGDFNPIGGLWKTEIFKLAEWLIKEYQSDSTILSHPDGIIHRLNILEAVSKSLKLKPTAGLGITNSDLEELGAESYEQVDAILQEILAWKWLANKRGDFPESTKEQKEMFLDEQQMLCYPIEVILNITNRHFGSEFKRKKMPIKIERDSII